MKYAYAITAVVAVGCLCSLVSADPIQISDNNVGDIVSVVANIEGTIESSINVSVVNVLVAILVHLGELDLSQLPPLPDFPEWPVLPPLNPEEQKLVNAVVQKMKSRKH